MLSKIYPEYDWKPWRFKHASKGFASDSQVMAKILGHLALELDIGSNDDWYRVSNLHIEALGLRHLIRKNGGLYSTLKRFKPEVDWDPTLFKSR